MRHKNNSFFLSHSKLKVWLGLILGLVFAVTSFGLVVQAQTEFPPLTYGNNQQEATSIENYNYRNLKNELRIQFNQEIKRIDAEYHECTYQNRFSPTIQKCAEIARNAKGKLALERQRFQDKLDNEHEVRLDKIGRYWDRTSPGTNRRDGTNGRTYVETRPKPKVSRNQGIYRKGKIIRNN